jgi:hypothetical protein
MYLTGNLDIGSVINSFINLKHRPMTKFKTIESWLDSNPSTEEKSKLLILINRGETSKLRKELWEKERFLVKLQSFANHCKKMGFNPPKEEIEAVNKTKKEIESLRKELPVIPKKEKVNKDSKDEMKQETGELAATLEG